MEQLPPLPMEGIVQDDLVSHDEQVILAGIEAAKREERLIDDRTARYIAAQLHNGQASTLYALASTGAIVEGLGDELAATYEQATPDVRRWVAHLGDYCLGRENHEPVPGWAELAAAQDHAEAEQEALDALLAEPVDDEVGSVDEIGWFGLCRHDGRPGGFILSQDELGFRHTWQTDSDAELTDKWAQVQQEYERFYRKREAAERSHDLQPQIWVASLSDYNQGRYHGVWIDADQEPDELHDAIQFMLRNSYVPGAEEWAIFDHSDFCGFELSEYADLATVSLVAKGVVEHGEAFAAWVNYVGAQSTEAIERFEDHYLGRFDSLEAYAEHIFEETEAYRYLDDLPEGIRQYATLDTDSFAHDLEIEMYVVEGKDGGVHVFDPRC